MTAEVRKYKIGLIIDDKRYEAIKGTPLEQKIERMFGGYIRLLTLEVDEETARHVLKEFPSGRIDARGFLEDLPVAFKRALFEAVVKTKSLGKEAIDEVFKKIDEIKAAAEKEKEYVPPPA
ncbi:MAG: hypothetical protein LM577_04940 [Thermoproteaceae archaeon]|jgi:hypothetical protein|nr:hypothetical protein [Thermoproteaceae archaeon]